MSLTHKQETFCQNIVKGMSQYESYCNAYDTKTDKREVVDNNAAVLIKDNKISMRIEELRKPSVLKTQRTLDTILEEINSIKLESLSIDNKLALDCLKHEAKLKGFEVTKTDLSSTDGSMSPTIIVNTQLKKQGE